MNRTITIRCDARPIFQAKHIKPVRGCTRILPLQHVEDALIATQSMKTLQDKADYFLSVGLDFDRVITYFPIVCALNEQWNKPPLSTKTAISTEPAIDIMRFWKIW